MATVVTLKRSFQVLAASPTTLMNYFEFMVDFRVFNLDYSSYSKRKMEVRRSTLVVLLALGFVLVASNVISQV